MPDVPGGGTVAYVNADDHDYLADPEHREEGGTPAIIEAVRAGLVFQLKEAVGVETIRAAEERFLSRAVGGLARGAGDRDPRQPRRRAALDRLVRRAGAVGAATCTTTSSSRCSTTCSAIQSRGGCSCAGPYGHRLLGIDIERSHEFEREITGGCEGIKPGWVRVNFNYFLSDAVADYIVEAVRLVARDGWRLLGDYRFDTADRPLAPPRRAWSSRRSGSATITYADDGDASRRTSQLAGDEDLLAAAPARRGEDPRRRRRRPDLTPADVGQRRLRAPALVRPAGCRRPRTSWH